MENLLPGFSEYTSAGIVIILEKAIVDARSRNRSEEVYNLERIREDILNSKDYDYLYNPETDEVYRITKDPSTLYALHGESERRYVLEMTNVCIACVTLVGMGNKTDIIHLQVPDKVGSWRVINSVVDIQVTQDDGDFYVTKGIKMGLGVNAVFAKCPDCERYFLI